MSAHLKRSLQSIVVIALGLAAVATEPARAGAGIDPPCNPCTNDPEVCFDPDLADSYCNSFCPPSHAIELCPGTNTMCFFASDVICWPD